jgi:hypothetical protein
LSIANRWQLSRVVFTAFLPSLIRCSAAPRLLQNRTTARLFASRFVTMKPARGNHSPLWNSTFATTRRAFFQLSARQRNLLYQTTGLWLGLPTGRVNNSARSLSGLSLAGTRMAYFTPRSSSAS